MFNGETITDATPLDMIKKGMLMTPEKRADGLFRKLSVVDNICSLFLDDLSSNGLMSVIDKKKSGEFSLQVLRDNEVKYDDMYAPVAKLSGGNMQKVIIGRSFANQQMKLLILDEPTTGIDIGAKMGIYRNLRKFAAERNVGVVFISSELDELLAVTDRLYVMAGGNIIDQVAHDDYDKMSILETAVRGRKA